MRSRPKIVEAVLDLVSERGFEGASVSAVATRAGVSRQTVYSIFGSREDMVSQAMIAVVNEATDQIAASTQWAEAPADYLVELIVAGRRAVREHPAIASLVRGGASNPLFDAGMMARARPIGHEFVKPMIDRFPQVASSRDDIVEMTVRIGLSVVVFDDPDDLGDNDLRAFLRRWLRPALG